MKRETSFAIQPDQYPADEGQSQEQGNLVGTVKRHLEADMGLTSEPRNTHYSPNAGKEAEPEKTSAFRSS